MNKYVIGILIVLLLAITACSPAENTQASTETETNDNTDADSNTASTGTGTAAAKSEVQSIFAKQATEYMAQYTITTNSKEDGLTTAEYAMYIKGDNLRTDTETKDGSDIIKSRTIITSKEFIVCTDSGDGWNCFKYGDQQEAESSDLDLTQDMQEMEDNIDNYFIEKLPDRTIAGTTAKCFKMSFAKVAEQGSEIVCYSKEGVPLYIETITPEITHKMEAKSYKPSVSSSDFTPPATPQDFSAMIAEYANYDYQEELPENFEYPEEE